jgi:signal transduction histidine kinase
MAVKQHGIRRLDAHPDLAAATPADESKKAVDALTLVSQMVAGDLDVETVLRSAMHAASEAMNAEACTILLTDADTRSLRFHLVDGPKAAGLASASLPIDDHSIAGWVAAHQLPLLVADPYRDDRFNPDYDRRTGFRTRSIIAAPMTAKDRQVGVLEVMNPRDGQPFSERDLSLAHAVADLIAVAIYNAEEHQARLKAERLAILGQTIAGMAHCVKNILNGLQAGSYIIDQNLAAAGDSKVVHGWKIVKRNMQSLSSIVLDMLTYSKQRKPVMAACRIGEVCEDVAALLKEQAAERGVTLVTSCHLDEVWVDEASIRRCLINLAGNAIDACGQAGGLVEIEAAPAETPGRFAIRIRDNGCGMDDAARARLFEPFFSTKGGKGTGLGLSVTKKIVDEHGGEIRVKSAPGAGTEFALILPAGPPEKTSA